MTMTATLPSAKIYQFPVGGRRGLPGYRAESTLTAEQDTPRLAISGWYHEAAIEEARRGIEH